MATLLLIPLFSYLGGAAGVGAAGFGFGAGFGLAVGTAVGSAIGGIAGAYIDQTYVYPLFQDKPKNGQGPRLDDLPVQTGSEGSGMNYCTGRTTRVAGTVIWLSDLIEVRVTHNVEGGKGGGGGSAKNYTYDYYYHVAIGVCEGEIEGIDKIWADSKVIYDSSMAEPKDSRVHLVRIYTGSASQAPDSIISGFMGAENTPGFRNTAYVVLEGLLLRDFGNRLPQFTFQVRAQNHESVSGAIYNILHRANILDAEFDVSQVDHSVRGYSVTGPTDVISAMEPLTQAYDVITQESNGVLKFFTRGYEQTLRVNENDLVAMEYGNSTGARPFLLEDPSGYSLPREINVRYIDPVNDYQAGSQRYSRNDAITTAIEQIDVPLVMSASDARNMAANRMWRSYGERVRVSLSLPPRYLILEENDIITVPWNDELYSIRITQIDQGNNFLLQCKGLLVDLTDADEAVDCSLRLNEFESMAPAMVMFVQVYDVVALREPEAVSSGYYIAAAAPFGQTNFTGAAVYESVDNINFHVIESINEQATMGHAVTSLVDPGVRGVLDEINYIDVIMQYGDLESVTETQLFNGANRAFLGKELLGFKTATVTSPNSYRLTGLLRGLRATSSVHTGLGLETFVLLSPSTLRFHSLNAGAIGTRRWIKVVQDGQSLDDVPSYTFRYVGNNLKQLPPAQITVTRDITSGGSYDITVDWVRSTRFFTPTFASHKPLGADEEKYIVDIFYGATEPGPTAVPLRTVIVTSPTITYLQTDQAADTGVGYPSFASFYFKIYQVNEQVGRGYPGSVAIT